MTEDSSALDAKIIGDQGDAQTTMTYDSVLQSDYPAAQETGNVVTGGVPCTRFLYLDMRKITDINVRKAIGYAFPYKDYWLTGGEIVGVTRVPGTTIMPPGIPGQPDYDILGTNGDTTDPEKAKQLLQEAGEEGYQLDFVFAADDPIQVDSQERARRGLRGGRLHRQPDRVDDQQDPDAERSTRTRRSTSARGGWCSDWPKGSLVDPAAVRSRTVARNYSHVRREEDHRRHPGRHPVLRSRSRMPAGVRWTSRS